MLLQAALPADAGVHPLRAQIRPGARRPRGGDPAQRRPQRPHRHTPPPALRTPHRRRSPPAPHRHARTPAAGPVRTRTPHRTRKGELLGLYCVDAHAIAPACARRAHPVAGPRSPPVDASRRANRGTSQLVPAALFNHVLAAAAMSATNEFARAPLGHDERPLGQLRERRQALPEASRSRRAGWCRWSCRRPSWRRRPQPGAPRPAAGDWPNLSSGSSLSWDDSRRLPTSQANVGTRHTFTLRTRTKTKRTEHATLQRPLEQTPLRPQQGRVASLSSLTFNYRSPRTGSTARQEQAKRQLRRRSELLLVVIKCPHFRALLPVYWRSSGSSIKPMPRTGNACTGRGRGRSRYRINTPASSPISSDGTATSPSSALEASSRWAGRMRTV